MKKKIIIFLSIIILLILGTNISVYTYLVIQDNELSKQELVVTDYDYEIIRNIFYSVETGNNIYGKKDYANITPAYNITGNETSITIGAGAFYGMNAQKLLSRILKEYPEVFLKYDTSGLKEDINNNDWDYYQIEINSDKALNIAKIIGSKEGIIIQDKMMDEMILEYLKEAKEHNINDIKAMTMYASIIHLGGKEAAKRILSHISRPYTLKKIYKALNKSYPEDSNLTSPVNGELFRNRHKTIYNYIEEYL